MIMPDMVTRARAIVKEIGSYGNDVLSLNHISRYFISFLLHDAHATHMHSSIFAMGCVCPAQWSRLPGIVLKLQIGLS